MTASQPLGAPQRPFASATIIGLGLIGGSLARAIRRFQPETRLRGVETHAGLSAVADSDLFEACFESNALAEACRDAELVVVCTPVAAALELLPRIARATQEGTVVTDVCSLKDPVAKVGFAAFAGGSGSFIGGHPMAGGENSGFRHGDPFLFQNSIHVLTPQKSTPAHQVDRLAGLVAAIGAHCVLMTPQEHDSVAAAVSHMPQLLAIALMRYIAARNAESDLYLRMAAGGFRDMTRIASSPFSMWRDICSGNKERISKDIEGLIESLREVQHALQADDLESEFAEAARSRLAIPSDTRGFLKPHYDVLVEVEDKHGVIADLAVALAEQDINIKDIEVLKVRENEGGTMRLAFASRRLQRNASACLEEKGYVCRVR